MGGAKPGANPRPLRERLWVTPLGDHGFLRTMVSSIKLNVSESVESSPSTVKIKFIPFFIFLNPVTICFIWRSFRFSRYRPIFCTPKFNATVFIGTKRKDKRWANYKTGLTCRRIIKRASRQRPAAGAGPQSL